MQRHVCNLSFGAPPFGDVFMGANPTPAGHGFADNRYFAAIPPIKDLFRNLSLRQLGQELVVKSLRIDFHLSEFRPMLKQLEEGTAWLHDVARQSVHLDEALVENSDSLVRIEHDEALHHVIERC